MSRKYADHELSGCPLPIFIASLFLRVPLRWRTIVLCPSISGHTKPHDVPMSTGHMHLRVEPTFVRSLQRENSHVFY